MRNYRVAISLGGLTLPPLFTATARLLDASFVHCLFMRVRRIVPRAWDTQSETHLRKAMQGGRVWTHAADDSGSLRRVGPIGEALAAGAAIDREAGARLLLVSVQSPPSTRPFSRALRSLLVAETRELSELARVGEQLSARAERLRSSHVVADARIGVGGPADVIVDAAGVTDADLIVMAPSDRSRLGHRLQRGNFYQVLRRAQSRWSRCHLSGRDGPFATTGNASWCRSTAHLRPKKRSCLRKRWQRRWALASSFCASFPRGGGCISAWLRWRQQVARSRPARRAGALVRLVAEMRANGQPAEFRVVLARDPAAAIAGTARRERAGLIAMSTRGHGPLRGVLMGSVASATLQRSRVPVLIVRAGVARPTAVQESASSSLSVRRIARMLRASQLHALHIPSWANSLARSMTQGVTPAAPPLLRQARTGAVSVDAAEEVDQVAVRVLKVDGAVAPRQGRGRRTKMIVSYLIVVAARTPRLRRRPGTRA